MLLMPEWVPETVGIVGIDPGSHTLGIGLIELDINTLQIVSTSAKTYAGAKMGKNTFHTENHGERAGRIFAHRQNIRRFCDIERPFLIASEAPFSSRLHPQVFGVLTEVVDAIRAGVRDYDQTKDVLLIDPPSVKNGVGAPGNASKDVMREKVMALPDLNYNGDIPLHKLDEHSIDGIAVAYCTVVRLRKQYVQNSVG